jgi:hypothetical protein
MKTNVKLKKNNLIETKEREESYIRNEKIIKAHLGLNYFSV